MSTETEPLKVTLQLTTDDKELEVRADAGTAGEAIAVSPLPSSLPLAQLTEVDPTKFSPAVLKSVGRTLYQSLLSGPVASLTEGVVQDSIRQKQTVHFELRFDANQVQLTQYPWEMITNDLGQFLVRDGIVNLTRYITYPQPLSPFEIAFKKRPLLQVIAQPPTLLPLTVIELQLPRVEVLRHATFEDLQERVLLPRIELWGLQFDGHGGLMLQCPGCGAVNIIAAKACRQCGGWLTNAKKVGALAFERNGDVDWIPVDEFGSILFNSKMQLAVLSSCETALVGDGILFSGLAPGLILAGVPAVIGMQFPVADDFASSFTKNFYAALLRRNDLLTALQIARRMNSRGAWYSPALYLRSYRRPKRSTSKPTYHTRNVDTAVPAEVQVGTAFLVRLWIRRPQTNPLIQDQLRQELGVPKSTPLSLRAAEADVKFEPVEGRHLRRGEVDVTLNSTACDIEPERIKLFVDEDLDAPPAIFTVKTREVGQASLLFNVWQDGGEIASAIHHIQVLDNEANVERIIKTESLVVPVRDSIEPITELNLQAVPIQDDISAITQDSIEPTTGPSSLPLPRVPTVAGKQLAEVDPELQAAWRSHILKSFENSLAIQNVVVNSMNFYRTTAWIFHVYFGLGVAAFMVATIVVLTNKGMVLAAIFGGLSVTTFLIYFFSRPHQTLEKNLHFATWLGIIYESYWIRLANITDSETQQQDIEDAATDAIAKIKELVDKHTESNTGQLKLGGQFADVSKSKDNL